MSKAPPFDQAILAKAKEKFIEELRHDIQLIQEKTTTIDSTSKEEMAKIFHKIKGACGFFGLTLLESNCAELIKLCREIAPVEHANINHVGLLERLDQWITLAKDICD